MRRHVKALSAGSLVGVLALAIASLLAFAAPQAMAAYEQVGTFAGNGSGEAGQGAEDGQLDFPGQADVNDATGQVYVADTNNDRVQAFKQTAIAAKYEAKVSIVKPTGLAVDQDSGDVYVANAAGISKFDSSLAPITSGWTAPTVTGSLAVDPSTGDLLVADTGANLIRRFEADGTAAGSFAAERPVDVAANSLGEIFVVTSNGDLLEYPCEGITSVVERFDAAGVSQGTVGASLEQVGAVAVDPDDDSIVIATDTREYICEHGNLPGIAFFDSSGAFVESVDVKGFSEELGPGNPMYATVPGLAAQGGGSERVYAVTKSPFPGPFGATLIAALEVAVPPTVTLDPIESGAVTATEATFSGTVNPNGRLTEWHFEYAPEGTSDWLSTPTGDPGKGEAAVPVTATVENLQPNRAYQVKLVANSVTVGPQAFTTETSAPSVEALGAVQVSDTGAWLRGRVNPNNQATTYRFEIGETTAYGRTVPAGTEPSAGNGGSFTIGSSLVDRLAPATTYHYRLAATNATGTQLGNDETFTTEAAPTCPNEALRAESHSLDLPECRAYEMASPPDKSASDVLIYNSTIRASSNGGSVAFSSSGAFAETPGSPVAVPYLASRGSGSWTTDAIGAPQAPRFAAESFFKGYTDDLSVGFRTLTPDRPATVPGAYEGAPNLYARQLPSGGYALLTQIEGGMPNPLPTELPAFAATSDDGSHMIFESPANLVSGATGTAPKLYEVADGEVRLAGILPAGEGGGPAPGGSMAGFGASGILPSYTDRAISDDGSRIFFTAPPVENGGQLYVREDGASSTRVNAPEPGAPTEATKPARFWTATPDGRYVFFTSAQKLVAGATAVADAPDLYRFDVQTGDLVDASISATGAPAAVGKATGTFISVEGGVVGASDDGSRVYFVAENQIVAGEPTAGGPKLYRWDEDEGVTYIATLNSSPSADKTVWWQGNDTNFTKQSRVSADGGRLLFTSESQLDPDRDNGGYEEIYLYDADSGGTTCVSCPVDGSAATSPATMGQASALSGSLERYIGAEPYAGTRYLPRYLADDGRRAFFMTAQSLLPADSNGVQDVYMWKDGTLSLISTGQSESRSFFGDASPDGSNVFIATRERLSSWDTDENMDVYDVRVGGGQVQQPPVGERCTGEACQGSGAAAPAVGAVATTGVSGTGNLQPKRPKPKPKCTNPKRHKGKGKQKGKGAKKGKRANASAKGKPCKRVSK